jgi:hypothetical protein
MQGFDVCTIQIFQKLNLQIPESSNTCPFLIFAACRQALGVCGRVKNARVGLASSSQSRMVQKAPSRLHGSTEVFTSEFLWENRK